MRLEETACLVTGGAGFIGSHLVDHLMERGCAVRVLDNLENGSLERLDRHLDDNRFEFQRGDICDPLDVEAAMEGVDVVFHLACLGVRHSLVHPYANHRVNADGTLLLLDAARRHGARRFVHCSTSEVYGTARSVPMTEDHPCLPHTVYGASKLAGEACARAYHISFGLPVVIIRPFNTFGPRSHYEGDAGEMIPKSIVRALAGRDILVFGSGEQTRDFTYVEDTARGLAAAAEHDALVGQTLNIGSRFEISIRDLARRLLALVGDPRASVRHTPDRPGDVGRLFADPGRFMELTGWQPQVGFDEGLERTVEWFRQRPEGAEAMLAREEGRNWQRTAGGAA